MPVTPEIAITIAALALPIQSWMIAPALALLLGCYLLARGIARASRSSKAVPAAIRDAIPGQVEIRGAAAGPYSIAAPITGKNCYLYRTVIWQQKPRTDAWERLAEETLHVPFFLQDATGQMLIEPMGADLEIPLSLREEYGASVFSDAATIPPAAIAFLARHRASPTERILIEEFCVEPGADLVVTGAVTQNPGIDVRPLIRTNANRPTRNDVSATLEDAPEIVRLSSMAAPMPSDSMTQQSRIAAALVKAGIQNPNAWAAAGLPAPSTPSSATAVLTEEPHTPVDNPAAADDTKSGFNLRPPFVLMKGAGDAPFVLSSRRTQPATQPNWQDRVLLGAGAVLVLVSLWMLLNRLI